MDIDIWGMSASALRVLVVGLVFGAGLPALFALGMRLHAVGSGETAGERRNHLATGAAYLVYAIIVAAVIAGVLWVTRDSLGHYFGISVFGA